MALNPSPTSVRLTDEDREHLEALMLFWDADAMVDVIRIAIAHERRLVDAMKRGVVAFDLETATLGELLRNQYRERVTTLRDQHAALVST